MSFTTYGGGIDQTAVIGHPPESRDWHSSQGSLHPEIHATARIEAFVTIDAGLNAPTHIGARSWMMKHVHVGHDAWVGDNVEIAPHTSVGGHVTIGDNVRVGQSAVFKPFVTIGEGARIGCGAVVVKDVPAGEVWVGNPARRLTPTPRPVQPAPAPEGYIVSYDRAPVGWRFTVHNDAEWGMAGVRGWALTKEGVKRRADHACA